MVDDKQAQPTGAEQRWKLFLKSLLKCEGVFTSWQPENSNPSRRRGAFSCTAGSRLGSGSRQSKGESYERPCVLSHRAGRWPVHFLPGGRAGRRPSSAFASRPAILFADV